MITVVKGTLFIDIDGTILHSDTEEPLPLVVKKINTAYDNGYKIILTTLRGADWNIIHRFSKINTERTLKAAGLKYHEIIWDSPSPRIIINDDSVKAIRHKTNESWENIIL